MKYTQDEYDAFDAKVSTMGRYYCRRCADKLKVSDAWERFSMGVYAGMLCGPCWEQDGRNHDRQFDPMDAGESYEEEEY